MKYLGVSRAERFSPNRMSGDAAVFRDVVKELERRGHDVACMTEQELVLNGIPCGLDGIFQMARSGEALKVLDNAAVPVVNTPQAVRNCSRSGQVSLLGGLGCIPDTDVRPITVMPDGWRKFPCWLKRGDSHALEQDDVRYILDYGELMEALRNFADRGIGQYVLQAHVRGWLIKFYGVRGLGLTDCYAATAGNGKFGLERYNDQPDQASVDVDTLTALAERAAGMLEVDVYGGDAVVGPDGELTIIDFNDWPSFRTCTMGAAQKIADLIIAKTHGR